MSTEQTTSTSSIHSFAMKWLEKFRNPHTDKAEFLDHYMADECEALGFETDIGHSFLEKYGAVRTGERSPEKIIDHVDDIMILGSAILSQWKYLHHFPNSGNEILDAENKKWFITVLRRLAELTDSQEDRLTYFPVPILTGKIHKVKIHSNSICYGPEPHPDDEVEQHLSITRDGRVFFSSYVYGDGIDQHRKGLTRNFKADPEKAEHIMTYFERCLSIDYTMIFICDVGNWKMEITNDLGKRFRFQGPLYGGIPDRWSVLSNLIRKELDMPNLYVFDGNSAREG